MLTLTILSTIILITNAQINVTQLRSNGVMFEPLGPALIYQSKWNLITRMTIIHPDETINFIKRNEEAAFALCRLLKNRKDNCLLWHKEIQILINNIQNQLEEIDVYLGKHRQKRELFDGVGKLSKYLFGTMDSNDAETIYSRLQTLEKHDNENLHLIQKQVTIIKSSFDTTSRYIQNITLHEEHLTAMMNNFTTKIGSAWSTIKGEIQETQIRTEINEILLLIWTKLQLINNHIRDQFTIINALNENKLHPLLISTSKFLTTYKEIISKTTGLISITDFSLIKQFLEIQTFEQEGTIIIKISIPLLQEQMYTLQKIYLIPMITQHYKPTIIEIKTNYILNGTRKQYLELTQGELTDQCKKCYINTTTSLTICQQLQPKILKNDESTCLSALLYNATKEIETTCQHRIITTLTNTLTRLVRKNSWLFNFHNNKKITSYCDKVTQVETISGTGILTLTQPCTFLMDSKEIPFESNTELSAPIQYLEVLPPSLYQFKLTEFTSTNNSNTKGNNEENFKIQAYHTINNELLAEAKNIEEFQKELNEVEQNRKTEIKQIQTNINSGTLILAIVIIITILLIKNKKYFIKTKKNNSKAEEIKIKVSNKDNIKTTQNKEPGENLDEGNENNNQPTTTEITIYTL